VKISDPKKLEASAIKNIIFDWGGVIINIDYNATVDAFKKLNIPDFDEHYTQARQKDIFDKFEIGAISPTEFRNGLRHELGNHFSDDQIDTAWGAMLLDIPKARVELLLKLKEKYRIFLLSNTNLIHEEQIVDTINQELGFEFFSLFEKVYLSHRIGMRKPNAEIFEYVVKENKLLLTETLFIDDSEQHVDGASKIGLQAFYLQEGMETAEIFNKWAE
jgi:putative hydrolase of the HAD superfamily